MKTKLLLIVFSLILISSCADIFIEDISDKEIIIKSPSDGVILDNLYVTFIWNSITDVEYYNLQIVKGTFEEIKEFYLDTILSKNKFSCYLNINMYQWHVCAYNATGNICSPEYSVTIDSIVDISSQEVLITQPKQNFFNYNQINFEWSSLLMAEKYRLEIRKGNWDDGEIDTSIITSETDISLFLAENNYSFGVQAENQNIYTKFSVQNLIVDKTPPSSPNLSTPENNAQFSDTTITFSWLSNDNILLMTDSLYISTTSNFSSKTDAYASDYNQLKIIINTSGTYYWKVKSYDMANNSSSFSETRSFNLSL